VRSLLFQRVTDLHPSGLRIAVPSPARPGVVAPDGEVTVSFNAPSTPGTYNFQRQTVHECRIGRKEENDR
jgi:hypothetical protein